MTHFNQLRKLIVVLEILFVLGVSFALYKIRDGYDSPQTLSAAQNVVLKYNEQGQLLNLGKPEAAQKIVRLLTEDWGCPVVELELDPNDLLVNNTFECMYQMAVIGYHEVVLTVNQDYKGKVYPAGSDEVPLNARYRTSFWSDVSSDGKVREMVWSGL